MKPWIAICVPVYKWPPHPKFLESVDRCEKDERFHTKTIYMPGMGALDMARSIAFAQYLQFEHDYEWYCQMDGDIEFDPDTVWQMINRDVNVIGAAYCHRADGPLAGQPVVRLLPGEEPNASNLLKIKYLGGGCTYVRHSFIMKMLVAYPELEWHLWNDWSNYGDRSWALWTPMVIDQPAWGEGKRELLSEDWAFCHRMGLMNEPVWLDLCSVIGHWDGDKCYRLQSS